MTAAIKQFAAAPQKHSFTATLPYSQPFAKFQYSSVYFFCCHKGVCGGAESDEVT